MNPVGHHITQLRCRVDTTMFRQRAIDDVYWIRQVVAIAVKADDFGRLYMQSLEQLREDIKV